MSKRRLTLLLLTLILVFTLSGCSLIGGSDVETEPSATVVPLTEPMYTDREALYRYYNDVTFADTQETLTERYGEPEIEKTDAGESYLWVIDKEIGYGFAAAFFDSGKLRAKILYYKDMRQLGALSEATSIDSFSSLSKSYTYELTCGLLGGKPMEIAQIAQDTSADPEIKRLFAWCTSKGDCVQVLFSGDEKVEQVNYTLAGE